MKLSREERLAHMAEASKVLKEQVCSIAVQALALNLALFGLAAENDSDLELIEMAISNFAKTIAMTARLQALGIPLADALATPSEVAQRAMKLQKRMPEGVTVKPVWVDEETGSVQGLRINGRGR